jgi:ABC-type multidrug transport system ATPase subunit
MKAVIETKGLIKKYGKTEAVHGVDLCVEPGKVFALMGRNGAGKTSIIRMLLGLTPITKGAASVLGLDSKKEHVAIRKRVGYVPEEHHMYRWMKVREIAWFTSSFYPTWDNALCDSLMERFGLDPNKKIKELSRGMIAKTALVLALSHRPEVLVLDEPTSGLDAVIRKEFLESVVDVAADEGRSVLISSHLLNDVERVTDRVALLDHGRIKLTENLEDLKVRVREVSITFNGPAPTDTAIPGALRVDTGPAEWGAIFDNYSPATLADLTQRFPTATLTPRTLTLEEIFVALVGDSAKEADSNAA